ncbi:MAG: FecR domain-containing protein [Geminicoccaceae bacterium]
MTNHRHQDQSGKFLPVGMFVLVMLAAGSARAEDWVYSFEPGDSVWKIAHRHLRDPDLWNEVRERNRIESPRRMPVGSKLLIPREWLREQPMTAALKDPAGTVRLAYADGSVSEASAGEIDDTADVVVTTGSDGRVSVILGDGSTVDLGPDSRLSFVRLTALGDGSISDIEMKLESGSAATFFPSAEANPGRFLLWTKPAVTSVRGTVFRVAVDDGGESARTEVLKGGVDFAASGETVRVPLNYGSAADYGQPPVPPRPLLAAPDLSGVPKVIAGFPSAIRFAPVDEAQAYHVEIARDETANSVILDRRVDVAAVGGIDLPDGSYRLRVRAVDDLGLEGIEAARPIEIDARPIVPAPMREGRFRSGDPVRLAWESSGAGVTYTVRLADNPQMANARTVASGIARTSVTLDDNLEEGRYWWQVMARDAAGDEGRPSRPTEFGLVPPPQPVRLSAHEGSDGRLDVSWPEQEPLFAYRVEIAKTRDFATVDRTFEVKGTHDSLPRPLPGTWWVRARAIDEDGYAGPYGEPVQVGFGPRPLWAVISIPAAIAALALML